VSSFFGVLAAPQQLLAKDFNCCWRCTEFCSNSTMRCVGAVMLSECLCHCLVPNHALPLDSESPVGLLGTGVSCRIHQHCI
jgi:hypothetical protein